MTMPLFPSVTLDGKQFYFRVGGGPLPVDSSGVEWILTKFDGWIGKPAPRTQRTDRQGRDGSFRSASFTGPKILALEVIATASDEASIRAAEIAMSALCFDGARLYELVVDESGGDGQSRITRSMMVERDDAITSTSRLWNSTTFSLQLAAPDPRKHASSWQTPIVGLGTAPIGGADFSSPGLLYSNVPGVDYGTPGQPAIATVKNIGTQVARPMFTVLGPLAANWQIVDTTNGVTLTYTKALSSTDIVTINADDFAAQGFPAHGVYLNTSNNQRAALLTPNGWPYVMPGQTVTYYLRSTTFSSSASMTVALRSAWH